ncbi:apolipoprotein N-acyltransferase [Aurantiacibacter rhizosphaerae]|uniref:apolipoprotein N-acyltransferase n=1 Tax=Aurantiacibacter rhizosphaerae TaxID=2691582 RepID=UPI00301E3A6F
MTQPSVTQRLDAHPHLASLGLGLLSATGFQPLGLWPVALLAVGLFALIAANTASWLRAFRLGWLFGVAHFTLGNNWIATAFTFQSEMPAMLGWAAVPLLALYLAVYPALAAIIARLVVRNRAGLAFALTFAGAWIFTEWLRSWVFSGYVWNPLGMVLLGPMDRPGLAAITPIMGTYALSGLAVLLGCALVLMLKERNWLAAGATALLLVAGMFWPAGEAQQGDLLVTIVQPDIRQERISDPRFFEANYNRLAQLSRREESGAGTNTDAEPRIVLWPESGMADYLREGYPQRYYDRTTALGSPLYARRRLATAVGDDSVLLTGAVDLEIGADETGFVRALGARNAVTAIGSDGELLGGYAKAHLVPYGEYLPMREWLEPLGLTRLVAGSIDFWPGPGPRTLDLGEYGKVSPQVCYEIIFSGQVTDRSNRADYIFNPSNEAWFGGNAQPQFLAQSRMRAIEEGLPVLRATTTGISAVIDARGVVRQHLAQHVQGRIDARVPPATAPTLFARFGNMLGLAWSIVLMLAGFVAMRRQPV